MREREQERGRHRRESRAIEADHIITDYEEAHKACTGSRTVVKYRNGWAVVSGKRRSLKDLAEQTTLLWAAKHEREVAA